MQQIKFRVSPHDIQRVKQLQFLVSSVMDEKTTQSTIFSLAIDALQEQFEQQMGPQDHRLAGIKKTMSMFFNEKGEE